MDQVVAIDLQRGIVTVAFDGAPSIRIRERHFRKKPLEEGAYVDSEAYRNSLAALQFSDAYEAALTALDRSARTGRQLSDGLRRNGYLPEVADAVVARLRENGLIDDRALAMRMAETGAQTAVGRYAFKRKLMAKGISEEDASDAMDSLDEAQQRSAAKMVLNKYARKYEGLPPREARAKLSQALARRGFSWDVISAVLEDGWDDED